MIDLLLLSDHHFCEFLPFFFAFFLLDVRCLAWKKCMGSQMNDKKEASLE